MVGSGTVCEQLGKSAENFDYIRCQRSKEENNALLKEKYPNVPLCCGQDGILDVDKNSCSNRQVWL